MEGTKISRQLADCTHDFLSLIQALGQSERYSTQLRPEEVTDEFDRFKIWVGNIGLRSLDYRLRDASHLKEAVLQLLTALHHALSDGMLPYLVLFVPAAN